MLTLGEALAVANETLETLNRSGSSLAMFVSATCNSDGWVFEYNSVEFMETRDWRLRFGGNTPLLVKHDGSFQHLPIAEQK